MQKKKNKKNPFIGLIGLGLIVLGLGFAQSGGGYNIFEVIADKDYWQLLLRVVLIVVGLCLGICSGDFKKWFNRKIVLGIIGLILVCVAVYIGIAWYIRGVLAVIGIGLILDNGVIKDMFRN